MNAITSTGNAVAGAVAEAVLENPFVVAALVCGVIVYSAYKAAEAAVEAAPGVYDSIATSVSDAYNTATESVLSLLNGGEGAPVAVMVDIKPRPPGAPSPNTRVHVIHAGKPNPRGLHFGDYAG